MLMGGYAMCGLGGIHMLYERVMMSCAMSLRWVVWVIPIHSPSKVEDGVGGGSHL